MATRFAQQFARTAVPSLIRQFGEAVTYYADGKGAGREIVAMIEREVSVINEAGVMAQSTMVRVYDNATTGISATEINTGRDTLAFPLRVGETPRIKQIARVESTENGLVRFEVN